MVGGWSLGLFLTKAQELPLQPAPRAFQEAWEGAASSPGRWVLPGLVCITKGDHKRSLLLGDWVCAPRLTAAALRRRKEWGPPRRIPQLLCAGQDLNS